MTPARNKIFASGYEFTDKKAFYLPNDYTKNEEKLRKYEEEIMNSIFTLNNLINNGKKVDEAFLETANTMLKEIIAHFK